jgi:hypothetical protein
MPYKPKRKKVEFDANPNGKARIKKSKEKGKIIVWFSPENENEFADKKYVVNEWPDYIKPKQMEGVEWYVKLDGNGNKIFSIYPTEGMFEGHCIGLVSKEGEEPQVRFKDNQFGGYHYFIPLVEFTSDYPGMTIPYLWNDGVKPYPNMLRYNFAGDEETGETVYTSWGDNSIHTPKLDEFLTVTGVWDKGPIKWKENILPTIQKRIVKANKTFKFVLKNGFFVTLIGSNEPAKEEVPWGEDDLESDEEAGTPYEPETSDFENWDE